MQACRLFWKNSVLSVVTDFEQALREVIVDSSCRFFGRQVTVDSSGKACYEVVFDLDRRRQIPDVAKSFGFIDDEAEVELVASPESGVTVRSFVDREVRSMCAAICSEGYGKRVWFGELHVGIGVCNDSEWCVQLEEMLSEDAMDGCCDTLKVVEDAQRALVRSVRGEECSEETVRLAGRVVEEQLRLSRIELVLSMIKDREGSDLSVDVYDGIALREEKVHGYKMLDEVEEFSLDMLGLDGLYSEEFGDVGEGIGASVSVGEDFGMFGVCDEKMKCFDS